MNNKSSQNAAFVYPHQLFEENPAVASAEHVYIIEEPLFFTQMPFHKKKLMLHRASMRWYADSLKKAYTYVSFDEIEETADIFNKLSTEVSTVHITEVVDDWLKKRLTAGAKERSVDIKWHATPLFILDDADISSVITDSPPTRLESFYRTLRKQTGILVENGTPVGGEWNYDEKNREKLPDDISLPAPPEENTSTYVTSARTYIREHFPKNYGSGNDVFYYPVTRPQASTWLTRFFAHRFAQFGPYQDAIDADNHTLFHSMISPLLNIGLLEPKTVIRNAISAYEDDDIPLHSVEGFVRQVLGWREFMRVMYQKEGVSMRGKNYFDVQRDLPDAFWDGSVGIPPVDDAIDYVHTHGYAHHIERLMILSNFMLLCEIDPESVYEWFMIMFVDAYDWVMVPNVYDMGQFASGGVFATKPYISSSNYIRKMSNYSRGEWADIWDGLYWRFLDTYQDKLSQNHRMGLVMHQLETMNKEKLDAHKQRANSFLSTLF